MGSTEAGKKVAEICGRFMKRGTFELGGSDPFVVLEDCDMEHTIKKALEGRLGNTGQSCNNSKRFIIQDSIYNEFKERLVEAVKSYTKIGDPLE